MKYQYIAIEREYGSGGQMIAERLAELSGIPCFGREILERVARQMNLSVSQIEDCEERATGSILYSHVIALILNSAEYCFSITYLLYDGIIA